ncbi:hypothetical protein JXL21_11325 [Candidatus Bathyarchaeota archaeon]|nr:hypothetical protein [Candidatus Bathyarchaeota archaeon]
MWITGTRSIRSPLDSATQHETDLRLTYKRYCELYPHAKIPYRDYKHIQAAKAFKRPISSRKIQRMVR